MKIQAKKDTTLLELLSETFPESSKTHLKKVIKYGFVTHNKQVLSHPETALKKGAILNYEKYNGKEIKKEKAPFHIAYEDDALIVVLKPAGILTVGTTTEKKKSMYKTVLDYLAKKTKGKEKIFVVHRLDREVSGLLIFAKTEKAKKNLINTWDRHTKKYWALVENKPSKTSATIKSYLVEGPKQKMLVVDSPAPKEYYPKPPQLGVLHYEVLSQHGPYTLLDVKLETGRKNQIRVQLSHIGSPIVGDRKYGADAKYIRQVRLFAYEQNIIHPETGKRLNISLPMPKTFLNVSDHDERY